MPELTQLSVPAASVQVEIRALFDRLTAIRQDMLSAAAQAATRLEAVHPTFQLSARNLLHYLALRQHDLRSLQLELSSLGLSSLGRAEAHALATLDAVLARVQEAADLAEPLPTPPAELAPDFQTGARLLAEHSATVLGPVPSEHDVRIMVTISSEGARNYTLIEDLLRAGMNCMRINCAHDDVRAWRKMIQHLRQAEQKLGKSCRVSMDLAGPKLRTTGLPPGAAVLKVKPERNVFGQVLAPARLWLTSQERPQAPPNPAFATLPFPEAWLQSLNSGDTISLVDARGSTRLLQVFSTSPHGCWAHLFKTAYLTPATLFIAPAGGANPHHLPHLESYLVLRPGDEVELIRPATATSGASNSWPALAPARTQIGCTLPEVLAYVRPGEKIWFDDGKIGGVVQEASPDSLLIRITQARPQGEKLRNDKGINLPDTTLPVMALTEKDRHDLAFVAKHADMVALSFVNSVEEVELLQKRLHDLTDRSLPILLKIETRRGFEQLPTLLLSAMKASSCGVMIARGDLAVECGFERLAEVQEEILWLCEAAHVPVIWATQVLESLARGGMPSRAEITDAAMGDRAECVMLNKGPRVLEAVQILGGILRRMQAHQHKKSAQLRRLHVAQSTSWS
ncbi:pyruvate kinase [Hymenobacter tenuis]